ncbi:MAG: hypothetical protein WCK96_07715 [Methylococcales bacterium]
MEFNALVVKRVLGTVQTQDFSNWAENLLLQGCDSNNVAILASFGLERFPDSYEVERYFEKCIGELGLVLPEDRVVIAEYVPEYANELASNISSGLLKPREGLESLKSFGMATDYDKALYRIWDELAEDVYTLENGDYYLWNTGLSKDNIDEFIIQVARQFIQLCKSELPDDFFYLCTCDDCGHIGKAQLKRMDLPWLPEKLFRLIYRKAPAFKWICGHCTQSHLKNMFDYEGRKQYLKSQGVKI